MYDLKIKLLITLIKMFLLSFFVKYLIDYVSFLLQDGIQNDQKLSHQMKSTHCLKKL